MQKYYYNDGVDRFGPFTLEELQTKNITPATPVWYDGLPNWTPAGELEELKLLFGGAAAAAATEQVTEAAKPVAEEVKAAEPAPVEKENIVTVTEVAITESKDEPTPPPPPASAAATAVTAAASTTTVKAAPSPAPAPAASKPARKKGSPILTWVVPLLILGGTGYYIYQDMEKNNKPQYEDFAFSDKPADEKADNTATVDNETTTTNDNTADTLATPANNDATVTPANDPATTTVPPADNTKPTLTPANNAAADAAKKKELEKQKKLAEAKKKAEEEKKKLADAKKEEERKKQQAAKETEMRTNWSRYVTIGAYTAEGDDKIKPFAIPVSNAYPAMLDRVTLRVDYIKKNKVVGTETLVLTNIPAKSSQSIQATGTKKGNASANVYITGINSRQLHLCYPVNNGNPADPYFCN